MPPRVIVFNGRDNCAPIALELQQCGVSAAGAGQFLNGEPVDRFGDRRKLVQIIKRVLGLAETEREGLLLSAVRRIQATAAAFGRTFETSLSVSGAQQFLAGLPVVISSDRQRLAEVFYLKYDRPATAAAKNMVLKGKKILQN